MINKYVGAYMLIEPAIFTPIAIKSVTVTSVAHSPAVAAVHAHPNPYLLNLTRGINIYIVCTIKRHETDTHPHNYVMFIGDVSSVQITSNSLNTDYIINLVDNRRYITELPSYYLKLIRTAYEVDEGALERGGILNVYDMLADANFYGIPGAYTIESMWYYDIAVNGTIDGWIRETMQGSTLIKYWQKMVSCMNTDPKTRKGWEPYYINMNGKKRILNHHYLYDNGLYNATLSGEKAREAITQSTKNAHAANTVYYDEAMQRFSELGYTYNTNLFPIWNGGVSTDTVKMLTIQDTNNVDDIKRIHSKMIAGHLLGIVKWEEYDGKPVKEEIKPTDYEQYPLRKVFDTGKDDIDYIYVKKENLAIIPSQEINEDIDGKTLKTRYYAIYNKRNNIGDAAIVEFSLIPKLYGVMPPKCNMATLRSGMTFNALIGEPPLTMLKYNIKEDLNSITYMAASYPPDPKTEKGIELYHREAKPGEEILLLGEESGIGASTEASQFRLVPPKPGQEGKYHETAYAHFNRAAPDKTGAMDLPYPKGMPVFSFTDGKVIKILRDGVKTYWQGQYWQGFGNVVVVRSGYTTIKDGEVEVHLSDWFYCHLANDGIKVIENSYVSPGSPMAMAGTTGKSTGVHLHLMVRYYQFSAGEPTLENRTFNNYMGDTWGWGRGTKSEKLWQWVAVSELFDLAPKATVQTNGWALGQKQAMESAGIVFKNMRELTAKYYTGYTGGFTAEMIPKKTGLEATMTASGATEFIGTARELLTNQYHAPAENIYGLKRVSRISSATEELVKAGAYADDVLNTNEKFEFLKKKVQNDFWESSVSRNTGTIDIDGLDEQVTIGLPYVLYHPKQECFFYGWVTEVSHKIDNSSGSAYTQIRLNSLLPFTSIADIENMFSDYVEKKIRGESGLSKLSEIYAGITGDGLEEYDRDLLMHTWSGEENIILQDRSERPIVTIERLLNYLYDIVQPRIYSHDRVADDIFPNIGDIHFCQWMRSNDKTIVNNIIKYYDLYTFKSEDSEHELKDVSLRSIDKTDEKYYYEKSTDGDKLELSSDTTTIISTVNEGQQETPKEEGATEEAAAEIPDSSIGNTADEPDLPVSPPENPITPIKEVKTIP